jgi:hypothetical protein
MSRITHNCKPRVGGNTHPGAGTGECPNLGGEGEEEEARDMIATEETRELLFQ